MRGPQGDRVFIASAGALGRLQLPTRSPVIRTTTRTSKIRTLAAASAAVLVSLVLTQPAMAEVKKSDPDAFFVAVEEYQRAHPTDYEGLARVAEEYGGEVQISTNVTGPTSPTEAKRVMEYDSSTDDEPTFGPMANFPADAFTVSITSSAHPASSVVGMTGTANWRDNFAGQAAPFDIASLGFSSQCGTFASYSAATYAVGGGSTGLATLRDGGAGTGAPTWNVNAYTSGFANQADRILVSVSYDKAGCGTSNVQAGFIYEGNQGGSIVSVSAGFLGLSLSYSGAPLTLQKGTGAITI